MSVYLSLGSNIGNRLKNIQKAIKLLKKSGFDIIETSSIYETSPYGVTDQPDFLNLALKGETKFSPEELLKEIKRIEKEIGRKPSREWGPRAIDIDILFYNKEIINIPELQPVRSKLPKATATPSVGTSNGLKIPHPQLHKRKFVLIPLKEIAPRLVHPVLKKTVSQILKDAGDKGRVVLYNDVNIG